MQRCEDREKIRFRRGAGNAEHEIDGPDETGGGPEIIPLQRPLHDEG